MAHKITKNVLGNEVTIYWNNRVMQRIDGIGTAYEETNLYIVEVYYHTDGTVIGWTEKEDVYGHDLDELRQSLTWMIECLDKPILIEADLISQARVARENGDEDIFPSEGLSIDELLDSLGLEREDIEEQHINRINHWEDDGGK